MTTSSIILTGSAIDALLNKPLSKIESTVLWWLVAKMPPAGMVVSQTELGNVLKSTRLSIHKALKRLREIGLLVRGAKLGTSYHYKLNPVFIRVI